MIKLRIRVTKEVLEATKNCGLDPNQFVTESCALSYAVREIWPKAQTTHTQIFPFLRKKVYISHDQGKFVFAFDRAAPAERARMQPFSFEIEVPDEVISEVNIEEIRRICEGSKTLELVK